MIEERCVCCDLPKWMCSAAKAKADDAAERAERARLLALPGVFAASFAGRCPRCGERFAEGATIARGDGSWVCCRLDELG